MNYTIEPLDVQVEWEKFFLQYGPDALFQSWEWSESLENSGANVERFGIWKETKLVGIFHIVNVHAKRGSFLHVRHGPIFAEYSDDLWQEFTKFMIGHARHEHVFFFRISPLIDQQQEGMFRKLGYTPAAIHAMDAELCWVLSLDKTEESLLAEMRKTTRYEIRRAEKMGITVTASKDQKDLHFFFDLYDETAKRQGFVPHRGISEEFEIFSKRDEALLYCALFENKVIATAIVLFVGNQGIYHHGASITSSPPGSYAIQWQAIQEAKKRGMTQYNFWGIAPDDSQNHPWKGITLFKKGFGGELRQYLHAQDYPVSPLYILPKAIETVRRMRKGY